MALGKGAVEYDARFNVDRLGEVEPNDFGARVIRQGRDGEGRHQLLLPTKSPPRSPAAARARRSDAIRVAGVASLDYLVGALLQNPRHVEAERSGGLQFSLGQKLRMIALHKSQQP